MIMTACSKDGSDTELTRTDGEFLASIAPSYTLGLTTKAGAGYHAIYESGGIRAEVSESFRDEKALTKGNVSGDDVVWQDSPLVSLYLTDKDDNLLTGDIPLNPCTYHVYDKYDIANGHGTYDQEITGSKLFWEGWAESSSLKGMNVNFYGYYPRPFDETDWKYVRNSVIEQTGARKTNSDEWYLLPYNFTEDQTDENISYFDVMCSIPEDTGNSRRHGNRNKSGNNNIQMAFKHMFSLLEIEIRRSENYSGDCHISSLSISGNEVYSSGTLNIKDMSIKPGKGGATISRVIAETDITSSEPFRTAMILPPTCDSPSVDGQDNERLKISCTVDGAEYTCPLPKLKLESGKKYSLRLTVTPSGAVVFRIWHGASVTVGTKKYRPGEHAETSKETTFSIVPDDGFKIIKVLKNGVAIAANAEGRFQLDRIDGANTYYNVVAAPETGWYSGQDRMRIHFDGRWNDKYQSFETQANGAMTWSDLTGNGNEGSLVAFNGTENSGWNGNGLVFDGDDDILTYPGNISNGDYTIEMYLYVDKEQKKNYPRLMGEDEKQISGYPSFCLNSQDSDFRLSVCGNGSINHNLGVVGDVSKNAIYLTGKLSQLDFVYRSQDKVIDIYFNGTLTVNSKVNKNSSSIPKASLGNRIQDNTRAMKCKFYSFILYDRALTSEEIQDNLSVNQSRFGKAE